MGKRRKQKRQDKPREVMPPVANRVVDRIEGWAEEAAQNSELVLYDLSISKRWVIQVYVAVPPSDEKLPADAFVEGDPSATEQKGVDVAECAKVSRYLEALLDADEDVWDKYTIEVSSPGIERKLSKPKHFELSIGKDVRIVVDPAVQGETQITGALERFDQHIAYVKSDEQVFEVPFETISKANVAYDFS